MSMLFKTDLLAATRLTRAGRLGEATAVLQKMLSGREAAMPNGADGMVRPPAGLGAALRGLLGKAGAQAAQAARDTKPAWAAPDINIKPGRAGPDANAAAPGRFLTASFRNDAGSRSYKLYVPASHHGQAMPLVVMLHGCTQSPDDFAAGTRMNAVAETFGCLVAYPAQTAAANPAKCWNWFNADDQRRDRGEPSIIAGITREVMARHAVDPRRVYVAGLSAGGAAAAILVDAYPDLYAAIGVHSGLACGAASDLPSAMAAMRHGRPGTEGAAGRLVPAIVFHGTQDATVHPSNADAVIAQLLCATPLVVSTEQGRVPGGHAYRRDLHADAAGKILLEQWIVEGGGHAWSGGSGAGSYTDPQGPDASREMMRFFLEHEHPEFLR